MSSTIPIGKLQSRIESSKLRVLHLFGTSGKWCSLDSDITSRLRRFGKFWRVCEFQNYQRRQCATLARFLWYSFSSSHSSFHGFHPTLLCWSNLEYHPNHLVLISLLGHLNQTFRLHKKSSFFESFDYFDRFLAKSSATHQLAFYWLFPKDWDSQTVQVIIRSIWLIWRAWDFAITI